MFILSALPPIGPLVAPLAPITLLLPHWTIVLFFTLATFYLWLSYWPGRHAKVIPIRASPFSPDKVPAKLDTIVIGSGSGGSSCANILAQSGQRVLLLEQHEERTGGCTHSKFNVTSDLELGLDMLIHNYIPYLMIIFQPFVSMIVNGTLDYTTPARAWACPLIVLVHFKNL